MNLQYYVRFCMMNLVPTYSDTTAIIKRFPKTALKSPGSKGMRVFWEMSVIKALISSSVRIIFVTFESPRATTISGFEVPEHSTLKTP